MITLVCGPPCAGKSTLAKASAAPGDIVLDFDDFAVALGSPRRWMHSADYATVAESLVRSRIRDLAEMDNVTAWIIRAAPRAAQRERMADALHARIWLVDPGLQTCLGRAIARPYGTAGEIRKWYRQYTFSERDERVGA